VEDSNANVQCVPTSGDALMLEVNTHTITHTHSLSLSHTHTSLSLSLSHVPDSMVSLVRRDKPAISQDFACLCAPRCPSRARCDLSRFVCSTSLVRCVAYNFVSVCVMCKLFHEDLILPVLFVFTEAG
jgi:hypothetical protein